MSRADVAQALIDRHANSWSSLQQPYPTPLSSAADRNMFESLQHPYYIQPGAYDRLLEREQKLQKFGKKDLVAGARTPYLHQPYTGPAWDVLPGLQTPAHRAPTGIGSDYAAGGGRYADPQVAAMQQDLNSRGAHLIVDGIRGPRTRAAEQQYGQATARLPQPRPPSNVWSSLQHSYPVADDRIAGAFEAAKPVQQLGNPYLNSTGGANAWSSLQQPYPVQQTARLPQHRPPTPQWALPVQQAALPPPTMMYQAQQAQMLRNAAAAAQREAQGRSSSQGSRSGMGYSGGGYSSGGYSGSGGRSLTSGVGGAFKSR